MTRKNIAAMRELTANINHKNVLIIWISFADEAVLSSKTVVHNSLKMVKYVINSSDRLKSYKLPRALFKISN